MNRPPLLLLSAVLLTGNVAAADAMPTPNWDRTTPVAASKTGESRQPRQVLFSLAREGRSQELLSQVRSIAESGDLSGPERDRVLFELAAALGDFEPGAIDPEILEYLGETRSLARVPHEEHAGVGVPLYNIRSAAAGSLAEWARIESRKRATLETAGYPDVDAFVRSLSQESSTGLAARIRGARDWYDPAEREFIVLSAPGMAHAPAASVVLAELAPGLVDRPAVSDLLFDLLEHRELGSTAALLLGRSGDEAVLDRLAERAGDGDGLASRRASLAIDVFLAGEER